MSFDGTRDVRFGTVWWLMGVVMWTREDVNSWSKLEGKEKGEYTFYIQVMYKHLSICWGVFPGNEAVNNGKVSTWADSGIRGMPSFK